MSEYIEREKLVKELEAMANDAYGETTVYGAGVTDAMDVVKAAPAVDVAPICRFSKEEISRAMARTGKSEEETIRILQEWDRGRGDVDDIIDEWEDTPSY